MDLELATLNDMVDELRRRQMRFVLVAVEPNNHASAATVMQMSQRCYRYEMMLSRL